MAIGLAHTETVIKLQNKMRVQSTFDPITVLLMAPKLHISHQVRIISLQVRYTKTLAIQVHETHLSRGSPLVKYTSRQ